MYGAVANWCEQFGLTEEEKGRDKLRSMNKTVLTSVKSHEVQLLLSPPKMASGNSLQENVSSFQALSDKIHFPKRFEDAWLEHRVSAGMMYKTRLDEDDGYGQLVPFCREYHSARNLFERFRWFLELTSRFEFDFRRCGVFFLIIRILVCLDFEHMQCDCTCACAVAVSVSFFLWPWWFMITCMSP